MFDRLLENRAIMAIFIFGCFLLFISLIEVIILGRKAFNHVIADNETAWPFSVMKIVIFCQLGWPLLLVLGAPVLTPKTDWGDFISVIVYCPLYHLMYLFLMLTLANFNVKFYEDHAIYTNLFNVKKRFNYGEYVVKEYSATVRILKPYKNKKGKQKYRLKVNISYFCINSLDFYPVYAEWESRQKAAQKKQSAPESESESQ